MYEIIKQVKEEKTKIINGKEFIVITEEELKDLLALYRSKHEQTNTNIFI